MSKPSAYRPASSGRPSESSGQLSLDLDGTGQATISTGVGFYDHMLTALAKHSLIDLEVDQHRRPAHRRPPHRRGHRDRARPGDPDRARRQGRASAGSATPWCRWTRRWPRRWWTSPAGRTACIPVSRRAGVRADRRWASGSVPYTGSLTRHVLETLAFHAHLCLHVTLLAGRDPHHIVECQFKAVARALRDAMAMDPRVAGRAEHQGSACDPSRGRPGLRLGQSALRRAGRGPGRGRGDGDRRPGCRAGRRRPGGAGGWAFAACMAGLVGGGRRPGDRRAAGGGAADAGHLRRPPGAVRGGIEHGVRAAGCAVWPGVVERLQAERLPHMGWNTVTRGRRQPVVRRDRAASASTSCTATGSAHWPRRPAGDHLGRARRRPVRRGGRGGAGLVRPSSIRRSPATPVPG